MIFYSHCKINIGLRVTAKRDDGFHDIESLFYPVTGVCDAVEIVEVEVEAVDGVEACKGGKGVEVCEVVNPCEFSSSGIEVDCEPEKNLCVRAYMLLKEQFDLPRVKIHLHKNIPMGAGLGGGSANCAATIKGLNELFALGLSTEKMRELGARLGSDVPFFIDSCPAWVSGRGEVLEAADFSLEGLYLIIIKPEVHVGTAWAYSKIRPDNTREPLRKSLEEPIAIWKGSVDNDFEAAVLAEHPQIAILKQSMYDLGALFALMSGSGAAVYGVFDTKTAKNIKFEGQNIVFQGVI